MAVSVPLSALDARVASESARARLLPRRITFVDAVSAQAAFSQPSARYAPINPASSTLKPNAGTSENCESKRVKTAPPPPPSLPPLEVPLAWPSRVPVARGLRNAGNTCYLNATLQCLFATPPLYNLCASSQSHLAQGCGLAGWCAYCAFAKLMRAAHDTTDRRPFLPRVLTHNVRALSPTLLVEGRQEDAHEFLRVLLSAMQAATPRALAEARAKQPPSNADEIFAVFGGYLLSEVHCTRCDQSSFKYDAMMDLPLELTPNTRTLAQCIAHFSAPETLKGADAYACATCKRLTTATKQVRVAVAPRALCVLLKRFTQRYSAFGVQVTRNGTRIEYDSDLRLGDAHYALYGVVVHAGASMAGGHYYAYVKDSTGSWWRQDDSSSQKVSQSEALSQTAYVLFYMRTDGDEQATKCDVGAPVELRGKKRKRDSTSQDGSSIDEDAPNRSGAKRPRPEGPDRNIPSFSRESFSTTLERQKNKIKGARVVEALQAFRKQTLFGGETVDTWGHLVLSEREQQQRTLLAEQRAMKTAQLELWQRKSWDREIDKGRVKKVKKRRERKLNTGDTNAFARWSVKKV